MKTILVLGAGMSASSLIRYLLNHSTKQNWKVRVVDRNRELIEKKLFGHPNGTALSFDALKSEERRPEIEKADLVISMLPARFHPEVAKDCIALKKDLITPSYISPEMMELDQAAKDAGIVIMNEIGVDPGIDHMSSMKIIDEIKAKGGKVTSFKSYCGGLIAPESDDNPWNYKFTWNPRNVVLAGQGGAACFIRNGELKYIPIHKIFSRLDYLNVENFGSFVGYANRDSLSYRKIYGLEDIPTMFRGTLRRPGFCEAWQVFVELGMTDDSYVMEHCKGMTKRSYLNTFLPYDPVLSVEEKFKSFLGQSRVHLYEKFEWLGIFDKTNLNLEENVSPAKVLEMILVNYLTLNEGDKDMLVMIHEFQYELHGRKHYITSSMVNLGEDPMYTAMSNTVGLPTAMAAKMILNDQIKIKGVTLPVNKEIYIPILTELEQYGITFKEVDELVPEKN